ncbi:hypothetical protein JR316_0008140 [Psilocybe cubensis]|uniref:Uncharacterized protein n=2 Tax=Psilocybe cubensis TaxID=181762 RepID=A0A8H7XS62_PSICU|nr:hypothetical protein JR316_0008140 [Psilocybe cubensis]KAH9479546.1 hypothetical protein JR316_0008140 [Psilocybe cubensis]
MLKLFVQIVALLASASSAISTTIPGVVGPDVSLEKDAELYDACKAADPKLVFAGIRYGEGPPEVVQYNQCVPWRKNGKTIANAVFCQPASCYVFADEHCSEGPTTPAPVDVPVSVDFLNAADFVELLGQSAYCSPNGLPRINT